MADLVIDAAEVLPGRNPRRSTGTAGETITQGQVVYPDDTDGNMYKLASTASAATAKAHAIALSAGFRGQPVELQHGGKITIGGKVAVGEVYVVSATAGGIAAVGDLAAGQFVTIIGVGVSATQIEMPQTGPFVSGVAVA